LIQFPDKLRLFHANLLKKYWERQDSTETTQHVGAPIESQEDDGVTSVEVLSEIKENDNNVYINSDSRRKAISA